MLAEDLEDASRPAAQARTSHTNADDIELEATLQKLLLDLRSDAVETDMASGEDCLSLGHCDVCIVDGVWVGKERGKLLGG